MSMIVMRKQLDTSAQERNSVGMNTNVVKYGYFSIVTQTSTSAVSMSTYEYDYQCE